MKKIISHMSNVTCQMSHRGFTLIELLVVIAIIGVLSALMLGIINPLEQFNKAADSQRKSDLAQIQRALETYYKDYNEYPAPYSPDNPDDPKALSDWGSPWGSYIEQLPKDPKSGKNYFYVVSNDGQSYRLYASLDRGDKDQQACNNGAACTGAGIDLSSACGGACNFGVSSPDVSP